MTPPCSTACASRVELLEGRCPTAGMPGDANLAISMSPAEARD